MIEVEAWDGQQVDQVIHGSFEALMARIQVRADLAVTSPPYRLGGQVMLTVPSMGRATVGPGAVTSQRVEPSYDEAEDWVEDENYRRWVKDAVARARVVFWNVGYKFRDFDWGVRPFGHVVWFKPNAIPFSRAGVVYNHEYILLFGEPEALRFPVRSVWEMRPQYGSKHPAPFPLELPYRAILATTKPGDLVLDPFGGSGTTAATAKAMGRHWLTCDVSAEYCAWMDERLAQTESA